MPRKKQRNSTPLVFLVLLAIVLVGAYTLINNSSKQDVEPVAAPTSSASAAN